MATQIELAKHLDLSDRSVRELRDKAIFPNASRSSLDLDDCRVSYIRHLRAMAARHAVGPASDDLTAERARLAREQADGQALRNGLTRSELLVRAEVAQAVAAAFGLVRDRLLGLGPRLAGQLARVNSPGECREILEVAITEALTELSEARIVGDDHAAD